MRRTGHALARRPRHVAATWSILGPHSRRETGQEAGLCASNYHTDESFESGVSPRDWVFKKQGIKFGHNMCMLCRGIEEQRYLSFRDSLARWDNSSQYQASLKSHTVS
ncbi:hypothetical protein EJ04DRAFT_556196 [Polyplosphaeria fusca]|uniref:Uncharacterized protein n=1 Tax=Polyplosphaeria fusca TaxID=682080 RepID=A0A9P4QPG1_9PLEO|nr:hypothetical protein EJ04DRAFT_556196 [Polyplosphaeria fusca]